MKTSLGRLVLLLQRLEVELLLLGGVERSLGVLQLSVEACQDLNVALQLTGQFTKMFSLERCDFGFLLRHVGSGVFKFLLKKGCCILGKLCLRFQVLVDEQSCQFAVPLPRKLRRHSGVVHLKSRELPWTARRIHELNFDVIAHSFDWIAGLHQGTQAARRRIEMKAVNGGLKPCAAQNLL